MWPRLTTFLLLLALFLQSVLATWDGRTCPTPWCKFCLSAAVHDAPGIGFDLTTSYGTAVAHLSNGTVLNIAQIPATPAYQALIERLGNAPLPAPAPASSLLSRLTSWQRWWRKKRGLAATPDVEIIASLLIALKSATISALAAAGDQPPIDRAAVTRPSIPALTKEDLDDALEYAGLAGWMDGSNYSEPKHVSESQAVFAANGHGLCTTYQDVLKCYHLAHVFPLHHAGLYISLTRHALYMSLDKMRDAFPWWGSDGPSVLDFSMGLDNNNNSSRGRYSTTTSSSSEKYWTDMHTRIVLFVRQYAEQPVDALLLGGENATNPVFLKILRSALASMERPTSLSSTFDVDAALVTDPTFAAARGMAVYARRRQEAPGPCAESSVCEEEREKERATSSRENEQKGEL